jgi:hypothetical protein
VKLDVPDHAWERYRESAERLLVGYQMSPSDRRGLLLAVTRAMVEAYAEGSADERARCGHLVRQLVESAEVVT